MEDESTVVEEKVETVEVEPIEEESGFLENDPLNSIFSDETVEETVIKKEVVTAPEADKKVIEDTVVTTVETEKKDPDAGWKAAYFAEKNKRQAMEQTVQKEEPKPFDWTNPDETIKTIKNDLTSDFQTKFLSMSEAQCKARNSDYDKKYQAFVKMAQLNPSLANGLVNQPDPAQYAYDLGKQQLLQAEIGSDPATYREKIEAEIRAKIEIENKTKADDQAKILAGLPPSAANMSDKVPLNGVQKEPFEELFPGQTAS